MLSASGNLLKKTAINSNGGDEGGGGEMKETQKIYEIDFKPGAFDKSTQTSIMAQNLTVGRKSVWSPY